LVEHKDLIPPDLLLCNTAKGLYLKDNCLLSEAIDKGLQRNQPYAILSGPSFAQELMLNYPTAGEKVFLSILFMLTPLPLVVVASKYLYHAVAIQRALSNLYFRIYTTQDVIGVQLGGALKNPLAIGAGIIEGMGM
jgi:glycerol-3-phosphate dehydrogenase